MADNGAPGNSTETPFECPLCYKQYAIRSSYMRHSKICLERRISSPRRKACRQCSSAKTKCDLRAPSCSRCVSRRHTCEYASSRHHRPEKEQSAHRSPNPASRGASYSRPPSAGHEIEPEYTNFNSIPSVGLIEENLEHQVNLQLNTPPELPSAASVPHTPGSSPVPQVQPDDAAAAQDRWLYPYIGHPPARYSVMKQSMSYLCRIFRTYPKIMARREQLPPFIHPAQLAGGNIPLPLANCFALSRMWGGRKEEDQDGDIIKNTIQHEMKRLFSEYRTYGPETLLAAFQALLIYSIILLFPVPQKPASWTFDLPTLVSLQDISSYISESSLILPAETIRIRPSWEEWVLVGCKRRTIMALYCFEWIYAMLYGLPTFPCTDLGFIPSPAGKVLWNARTKEEWEAAYDRWLGRWAGVDVHTLEDLAKIQPGPEIDARTEMWLEEADEFGVMYMALVNGTEGKIET